MRIVGQPDFFSKKISFIFNYVCGYVYVWICSLEFRFSWKPEALDLCGAGVLGSCEALGGCWELKAGSLQKQYMLLASEMSPLISIN